MISVRYYLDVHIPRAIAVQLRIRGIDALRAQEDGTDELADDLLLERARVEGRVMVTSDIRFFAMACGWSREGRNHAGIVFGSQSGVSIGEFVRDLELIAKTCDLVELNGQAIRLPL